MLLINFNKKLNSSKTKHVEVNKQLDHIAIKVKQISTTLLQKDLRNNYGILNGGKYFRENESQNLVF